MQEKMIIDPDAEKINFITIYFNDEEALAAASEEDKLKYKEYIKEGVKNGNCLNIVDRTTSDRMYRSAPL